jgi:hypothetical protein
MTRPGSDACRAMAEVAAEIATTEPEIEPRALLRLLGERVAGIDPGIGGILDLARGGSNELWGGGFRSEFDDGTDGQARHFAGTAASAALFGPRATELVAHRVLDAPETADGRLSSKAVEFARLLLDGELQVGEAAGWIRAEICAPAKEVTPGRIDPPPHP